MLLASVSPVARAIDAFSEALPLGPDVAAGALLVLVLAAAVVASWARALDVPPILAAAIGLGATLLRLPWSSQAPGRDACLLLGALIVVRAVASPPGRTTIWLARLTALSLVVHLPSAAVVMVPALLLLPSSRRGRWLWATGVVTAASLAAVGLVRTVVAADACLSPDAGSAWLAAAVRPGLAAEAGALATLRQALVTLAAEVHLFGLAAAAWAMWHAGDGHPALRRLTGVWVFVVLLAATAGLLPLHAFVMSMLAAWMPWFALACRELWRYAEGRWAMVGRLAVVGLALVLPIGRSAVYVPSPLVAATPHVQRYVHAAADDSLLATLDVAAARQAHAAGRTLVPAAAAWASACTAAGRLVIAQGAASHALRAEGLLVVDHPVAVPLQEIGRDLRPGAVVALGVTADGMRWLRPVDHPGLLALGINGERVRRRESLAVAGQAPLLPRGGDGTRSVHASHVVLESTDDGLDLWHALDVTTAADEVVIRTGRDVVSVHAATAAFALFDREEAPVLRGTATQAPGLPTTVVSPLPELTWARVVAAPAGGRAHGTSNAMPPLLLAARGLTVDDAWPRTVALHVGEGWHGREAAGSASFRWSRSSHATATFWLERPSALDVVLDAAPAATADVPNVLHLTMNGQRIGSLVNGITRLEVPATATRAGLNTLAFVTSTVVTPGAVAGEPRALAALVRHVRIVRRDEAS